LQIDDCRLWIAEWRLTIAEVRLGFVYFNLQSKIGNRKSSGAAAPDSGLPCFAKRARFGLTLADRGHETAARFAGRGAFLCGG
jgi:hypothetical protein